MKKFSEIVLKYRLAIIIIIIGLSIFFGYGLTKISVNSDMLSYLQPDNSVVKLFNRIGEDYGGNTLALIAVKSNDMFSTKTLTFIKELTEKYSNIKGISNVMSLTNILDIKKTDDGLEISKLIDKNKIPQTSEALLDLKEYALSKDIYSGKIISKDGKITLLICHLKANANKGAVAAKIKSISESIKGNNKLYYNGLPLQMIEMNYYIINDLGKLIPIVLIMVVFILFISFRSKRGVILPLLTVFLSTIWAIGLMGWLGVQLSLISNIMPVLLIAIGTAYGIHFITKYNEHLEVGDDKISGIKDVLSEIGVPILLTGITTLIGFLSFIGSTLTAVTDFGIFTAFGVGVSMILSVTFVPAALSYMTIKENNKNSSKKKIEPLISFLNVLSKFVLKNEKKILSGIIVIILFATFGIPLIKTEVNMSEYSPEGSNMRISDELMKQQFGGSLPIQIIVKGDLKNPFVLKEMIRISKYMENLQYVNNTQSIANLICEMNDVMNGHYTIPETKEQVANLIFMLEGEDILDQLVNKDYSEGIIQARFGNQNTEKITFTVEAIDKFIKSKLDKSIKIVNISDIKGNRSQKLADFQIKRILTAIIYDANKRFPDINLKTSKIRKKLYQLASYGTLTLTEESKIELKEALMSFFTEEADIEIDSKDIIGILIEKIMDDIKNGPVSEKNISYILKNNIPVKYWQEDEEAIKGTAEFIFHIVKEKFQHNRIAILVEELKSVFPREIQNNIKFSNEIRDNLWILNEKIVGIPEKSEIVDSNKVINLSMEQSGMLKVLDKMNSEMLYSQLKSLFLSLGLVLIIMIIQFKSIKMGMVVTSPIFLTVLINFAVMGVFGIPLDNATMMIASIAIGIGIDYSIHFSSRFKVEIKKQSNELLALTSTFKTTGRAIIINALTVALGFIILLRSNMIPMQRFGWLISFTMVLSASASLTFLPSLILILRKSLFNNNSNNSVKK